TLISQYADCTFSELGSDERLPTTKVTGVRARFNQKTKHNQKPIWFVFLSFFHKSSSISLYFQRLVKD
ncbi:hypothetical protein, partial [Enterococcus camelliae]